MDVEIVPATCFSQDFTKCLQISVIKVNPKHKNIWLKINTKNEINQANYANQKNVNTKIKPQSLKVFRSEWRKKFRERYLTGS